jgi:hypothetical protein
MKKSTANKLLVGIVFVVVLIAVLALVVNAASGPSTPRVKKVIPDPEVQEAGKVTPGEAARFKCSDIDSNRERIRCRLNLDEENEYDYLPEECRTFINDSREACVQVYKATQKCWLYKKDSDRFICARSAVGIKGTVAEKKTECDGLLGNERADCILDLRENVDAVVKFRIYNLEEKAGCLMEDGVSQELVVDFVTLMEKKKLDYNEQDTIAGKKEVVSQIRKSWQSFVVKAKGQLGVKG